MAAAHVCGPLKVNLGPQSPKIILSLAPGHRSFSLSFCRRLGHPRCTNEREVDMLGAALGPNSTPYQIAGSKALSRSCSDRWGCWGLPGEERQQPGRAGRHGCEARNTAAAFLWNPSFCGSQVCFLKQKGLRVCSGSTGRGLPSPQG